MFRSPAIRTLGLAAALAVLPLSAALAGDKDKSPSEAAIQAAADAFEARMEAFGERAEAISDDKGLSEDQREARIAALWAEYQPEVAVFTAAIGEHAGAIAEAALSGIDVEALVDEALSSPEVQAAMAGADGMATNGAWAQNDPDQLVTYGLMAQYGADQAMDDVDGMDEAVAEAAADAVEANEDAAEARADAAEARADAAAGND